MTFSVGLEVEFSSKNLFATNPDNKPVFKKAINLEKEWYNNQWEFNDILFLNIPDKANPNTLRYKLASAIFTRIEEIYNKGIKEASYNYIQPGPYIISDEQLTPDFDVFSGIHLHLKSSKFKFKFLKYNLVKSFLFNVWLWYEKLWRGVVNAREILSHHLHGFWRNQFTYHYYFAVKPKFRVALYRAKTDTIEFRNLTFLDFLNMPVYKIIGRNKRYSGNYVEFLMQLATGKHMTTWNRFYRSPFLPIYVGLYMISNTYIGAFYNGQIMLTTNFNSRFQKSLNVLTNALSELSYKTFTAKKYLIPQYYKQLDFDDNDYKLFNINIRIIKNNPKHTLRLSNLKLRYTMLSYEHIKPEQYLSFNGLYFGVIDLFLADVYRNSEFTSVYPSVSTERIKTLQKLIKTKQLTHTKQIRLNFDYTDMAKGLTAALWIPRFHYQLPKLKTKVMNFDNYRNSELEPIAYKIENILENLFLEDYNDYDIALANFIEAYMLE